MERPIVHPLATQRSPILAQVDPDLVRATGFHTAFHHREIPEVFHHTYMGDRVLSLPGRLGVPPPSISPVAHQEGFNAPWFGLPAHHRQVTAVNGMSPKLPAKMPLGLDGAGKNHQAAGFFIQSMDRTHLPPPA